MEKLGLNIFFRDIKKVNGPSKIVLSQKRDAEIEASFECKVEFYHPQTMDKLDDSIEDFKPLSSNDSSSNEETEKSGNKNNYFCVG